MGDVRSATQILKAFWGASTIDKARTWLIWDLAVRFRASGPPQSAHQGPNALPARRRLELRLAAGPRSKWIHGLTTSPKESVPVRSGPPQAPRSHPLEHRRANSARRRNVGKTSGVRPRWAWHWCGAEEGFGYPLPKRQRCCWHWLATRSPHQLIGAREPFPHAADSISDSTSESNLHRYTEKQRSTINPVPPAPARSATWAQSLGPSENSPWPGLGQASIRPLCNQTNPFQSNPNQSFRVLSLPPRTGPVAGPGPGRSRPPRPGPGPVGLGRGRSWSRPITAPAPGPGRSPAPVCPDRSLAPAPGRSRFLVGPGPGRPRPWLPVVPVRSRAGGSRLPSVPGLYV